MSTADVATTSSIKQPKWHAPTPVTNAPQLHLTNTLTRKKELFTPINGMNVSWYSCGPTVYDASHMGHARSYLTFDILRRVMEDHFGYRVNYVMNITDIDDKIILRARQNYLCAEMKREVGDRLTFDVVKRVDMAAMAFVNSKLLKSCGIEQVKSVVSMLDCWPALKDSISKHPDASKNIGDKYSLYMATAQKVHDAIVKANGDLKSGAVGQVETSKLLDDAYDVLALSLDAEKGSTVTDHGIFRQLSTHWENEFTIDMQALNVRPPTVLTRVSEYVPEIVKYVEKIMENGFAYVADGSVYFDTKAFKDGKHDYAKLAPWSAGHTGLLEEGEGSLAVTGQGKMNRSDFALWKASKPGEPSWESPWGKGRPGWHIECSAMASDILGECMDIHSGGIDLCFPHHDNELAQSEAYYGNQQWVNYFLHAGHLHIEGQKMSKSLKNFISIKEALQTYTATQIRLMILMHSWDNVLDYKVASMQAAIGIETTLKNFFQNVKALKRSEQFAAPVKDGSALVHNFHSDEKSLLKNYHTFRDRVHLALCDSINTSAAMNELLDLVSKCNLYSNSRPTPNASLLDEVAKYVSKTLRSFGVLPTLDDEIGFPAEGAGHSNFVSKEQTVMPYLNALSSFRDLLRDLTRSENAETLKKEVLKVCDTLRDTTLPALGVVVEDRDGASSLVKLISKLEIEQMQQEKATRENVKMKQKEDNLRAAAAKKLEKLEKGRLAPDQMFRSDIKSYSQWDATGMPTHDAEGTLLTKSRLKKLTKEMEVQTKLHADFKAAQERGEI